MGILSNYARTTSSLTYSYLVSLPLLFLYELLLFISQPDSDQVIRLSADIWIKSIFSIFGTDTILITLFVAIVLGVVVYFYDRNRNIPLVPRYFTGMIGESIVWALVLSMIIATTVGLLFNMNPALNEVSRTQLLALSLGAGLYEELVFRVVLVSALIYLFQFINFEHTTSHIAAIITGAFIFSSVHYIGDLGDVFTISSFTFRFLFGIALNILFIYRGFGIAALTHSLYDVIVVLILY